MDATKNNPFPLRYGNRRVEDYYQVSTSAAPGPGTDIERFLHEVRLSGFGYSALRMPHVIKGVVTTVEPTRVGRHENHRVLYRDDGYVRELRAPFVINCLGTGKPKPPDSDRMRTSTAGRAGMRWQEVVTNPERLRDKHVTIVGLGNSAAEMLIQFQALNRQGYNINYRVFTHHTERMLTYPDRYVDGRQLFRDLSRPDLTGLAGDLYPVLNAFQQAMQEGRIYGDVTRWRRDGNRFNCWRHRPMAALSEQFSFDSDVHYTLIGFVNSSERLRELGIHVGPQGPAYDYDGEFHADDSGSVRRGYFGLGSILETEWNPNSVVIPGIMHQMYDLAFTLMARVAEAR